MPQYIMLGRSRPTTKGASWKKPDRQTMPERILERTLNVPGTSIHEIRLTLGRFDVVIDVEAQSHNAAFDLASAIQEATDLIIETMPVVTEDETQPRPRDERGDPDPVREPIPSDPPGQQSSQTAESARHPLDSMLAAPTLQPTPTFRKEDR